MNSPNMKRNNIRSSVQATIMELDLVAYKQQKYISHSFGCLQVQGQGGSIIRFWWEPSCVLQTAHCRLLIVASRGREQNSSLATPLSALIPFMRASPF